MTKEKVAQLMEKQARDFITAGKAEQRVPAHSPIPELLLAALNGAADRYQWGVISAADIRAYMLDQTRNLDLTPQEGRLNNPAFAEGAFLFRVINPAIRAPDENERIRLYRADADKGDAHAQVNLGVSIRGWPWWSAERRTRGRAPLQARRRPARRRRTGQARDSLPGWPWRSAERRTRGRTPLQARRRPGKRLGAGLSRGLLRGETPVVQATGARYGMSLISAVTARGHMRFMIKEKGGVNADVFIEFLKRLMVGATHPIFLIVDRGPAHRAKKTKAFVETLSGKLRLFFLPPYSPDRNPDELVWKHLKADTVGRSAIHSYADFKGKVKSSMHSLQRNIKKIRSFFAKDTLRYAA